MKQREATISRSEMTDDFGPPQLLPLEPRAHPAPDTSQWNKDRAHPGNRAPLMTPGPSGFH